MKTFESFLYEGVGDKLGKMSDEEFAKFQKGRTAAEAEGFREAREKARGKAKGGALAIRKPEEKTAGVSKPKAKEGFNKQRAASGPVSGMSRTPLTYRKGGKLEPEKKKEEDKKEKEKKDRKKLDLKKPLGAVAGVAKDAAGSLLSTDTRATVDTYEAQ